LDRLRFRRLPLQLGPQPANGVAAGLPVTLPRTRADCPCGERGWHYLPRARKSHGAARFPARFPLMGYSLPATDHYILWCRPERYDGVVQRRTLDTAITSLIRRVVAAETPVARANRDHCFTASR